MAQKIYSISGMHCTSCALNIEWELEDHGIKSKCNYVKQTLEIDLDPQKNSETEVRKIVSDLGYVLSC